MAVVVVESPAKAKTINKYLGKDYTVLASYGHVRDLPPKDGSVDPDNGFEMLWEVDAKSQKHVRAIAEALADDPALILATDPDREGEAISWHLEEALRKRRALKKDTPVRRVAFNAITKAAVEAAMAAPRDIDMELVHAYLARRALDYLVGFNLSPVLWRKLPGSRSAGRVQSVALRLIVEREMEIEAFKAKEYWSVRAMLKTPRGVEFEARLSELSGKKIDRQTLETATRAEMAAAAIASRGGSLFVDSVEAKPGTRNPSPPFMTSTLQQEASRKFGMGAQQTMRAAQRLYEAGHITYMRTDGIDMAPEAVQAARAAIKDRFGAAYVPEKPRFYKNKAKNAQEAHECIRPTDMSRDAGKIGADMGADERKLYDLIWKRTLASQMEAARLERTTAEIRSKDREVALRATGQVIKFDGFIRVYEEGRDEPQDDEDGRLPALSQGEPTPLAAEALREAFDKVREDKKVETQAGLERAEGAMLAGQGAVLAQQHFTQPPPRYTEATLVKRMEELGIGRPSTYASIIGTIQDREYVRKDKNRLIPEDKGRLVTVFLSRYFSKYVSYDFTAKLEEDLDVVSDGGMDWKALLSDFWRDFHAAVEDTAELRITEVLETINEALAPHLFPDKGDGSDPRLCPNCGKGRLSLRTARSGGAFIGCSNYPECRYTRPMGGGEEGEGAIGPDGKLLGHDDDGEPVTLRSGRFGPYVQLGELTEENPKPKRSSIPKGLALDDVDLKKALDLLALPRLVGQHPEGGEIKAGIGRFGPFVMHQPPKAEGEKKLPKPVYANLKDQSEVFDIGINRAVDLIAQKMARGGRGAAATPLKELGEHPDGGAISVYPGRYGPYVKWDKVNATLPKDADPQTVTLEQALELVNAKAAKGGKGKAKKAAPKKAAAKKPAAKKTAKAADGAKAPAKTSAAKKPAAKKAPAKSAAKSAAKDAPTGDPEVDDVFDGGGEA
ncbi:type I DNA topoisomerase [Albimonas sp. CAU 1670]|uniref:type I DNA topoisomerase n=1 Tax=Albimonas sp. CAU 1670 TaxID=3032599 RepID=UPI0023DC7A2A|nr:type I DNA topoisomerase [Albimonas sp. CAU 1670]MDF2234573.1 type I DNA topoisomerase [Albimonas sp. CAU 1670]